MTKEVSVERKLMQNLLQWKGKSNRKPLILYGARQVGKTWLLKEFGKRHFDNCVYLNFDNNPELQALFKFGYKPNELVSEISNITKEDVVAKKTLLIFDEVQECPDALTSLKYFCEEMSSLHVAAAGSLLGLLDHSGTGFPVGKVNFLTLHPMSFTEFLDATENSHLSDVIFSGDAKKLELYSQRLRELLKTYYVVGGMPEAVANFADTHSSSQVREIQQEILQGYMLDASKHLKGTDVEKVLAAWESIPSHLSHENKKFIFGHINNSARARDYRGAITWLEGSGIALKVPRVTTPNVPLSAYRDPSAFKLFVLDVGLLCAMSNLDASSVMLKDDVFKEFKGSLTEQYVAQQLISEHGLTPYYWSAENSKGEIDFLVHDGQNISAIEVKAEENLKSKSLRAFHDKHDHVNCLRFSLSNFRKEEWLCNVPLYAIACKNLWK